MESPADVGGARRSLDGDHGFAGAIQRGARFPVTREDQAVETVTLSSRTAVGDSAMEPTVFSDSASATSPKIV